MITEAKYQWLFWGLPLAAASPSRRNDFCRDMGVRAREVLLVLPFLARCSPTPPTSC